MKRIVPLTTCLAVVLMTSMLVAARAADTARTAPAQSPATTGSGCAMAGPADMQDCGMMQGGGMMTNMPGHGMMHGGMMQGRGMMQNGNAQARRNVLSTFADLWDEAGREALSV